jgi:type I restriction enzyme S subunit
MITLQERVHGVKPPQKWPLNKLHHVFTVRKGNKNIGMINDNLLSLSYGRIINKNIDTSEGLLPESFETYQIVNSGDIVMRLTDLQNDKRSLRQGLVKEKGIITSAYDAVYPAKDHDSRYWAYALLAMDLAKYYYSMGGGVRQSIKFKDFPNDWLHTPPHGTQKEIADFLDHETARIDQLIEKKKILIEKLKLRENSFIEDCLTGRDVISSQRQETNVPWLRTIPAHWKTAKLRHLVRISTGGRDTKDRVDNGNYPFYVRSMKIERIDSFSMNEEAVLTSGDGAGVGEVFHHVFGKFDLHQRIYAFTKFKEISGDYFYYFLRAFFKLQMSQWSAKSTVDSVRMPFLKTMLFAIPPQEEQVDIIKKITTQSEKYHTLIEKTKSSINLLQQFRNSLINEAVTGQLDIHKWQQRGMTDHRLDKIEDNMEQNKRANA